MILVEILLENDIESCIFNTWTNTRPIDVSIIIHMMLNMINFQNKLHLQFSYSDRSLLKN